MSVGDAKAPPGSPPRAEQAMCRREGSSVIESRPERIPAALPRPDGPIATAMEVVDLVDGAGQQNRQSSLVTTFQSPRASSRPGENIERVMSTSEATNKDGSSVRGTAVAIIVNDALAGASAAVASSKKRPQSFAGHEHSVALGRVRETLVLKRRSRYDTDRFERWRPKDRNGGDVTTLASEASGVEHAGSTSAAGRSAGVENLEPEPQPPVATARRFTAHVLPSIPEHRALGRRVLVRETSGGGGKAGNKTIWNSERVQNKISACGVHRGERKEEEKEGSSKLEPSLALALRKGKVLDVPQGLFGETSSTGVDPLRPPCAAVDGVLASFWLSTGLYPQTLTIRLQRPVAIHEVLVACGGVNAARVHLGHVNSSVRFSSSGGGGGTGVGGGYNRDARASQGARQKEGSLLELVREQEGYSRSGPSRKVDFSLPFAKMTFRVPAGGVRLAEEVDRLSIVVTSARAPFCVVTSVTIRGQIGGDGADDDEEEEEEEEEEEGHDR